MWGPHEVEIHTSLWRLVMAVIFLPLGALFLVINQLFLAAPCLFLGVLCVVLLIHEWFEIRETDET